ncbi:ABC transporter permease [Fulvivirga sp. 29W222]|uniref:ABC transporter permease n=1 Tax=Fulvivirga marina TaxID=2494733 RepID=A0A937FVL4_9BACT|nr:ABC transporter permease [Fulvivirga marina]MBL6445762.1 ABC transporter permease [Fulvivirga marina]
MANLITICGLLIGMASVLLAGKYVGYSLTLDENYNNRDRIFHIDQTESNNGNISYDGSSSYRGVGITAMREIPEVENYTKFDWHVETLIYVDDDGGSSESFNQTGIFSVDSTFTKIFNLERVDGDLIGALERPNSIIITEDIARQYFGNTNALGKSIRARAPWGQEDIWTITCVVKDPPASSNLDFNILLRAAEETNDLWENPEHNQYILIGDSENYESVAAKISDVINRKQIFKGDNRSISITLKPLKPSLSKFEILLISIGVLIMILSWISFSNLSVVQFMRRQSEMFIRRSIGASNTQLLLQYLFETALVLLVAIGIAVLLLNGVYDYFSGLAANHLLPLASNKYHINTIFIAIFILGALLPSLYVLKTVFVSNNAATSQSHKYKSRSTLLKRRLLTGFQFAIAVFMMSFTYIMDVQIKYLYDLDKGIELNNKLIIKPPKDSWEGKGARAGSFRYELKQISWVENVSSSSTIPGQPYRQGENYSLVGSDDKVLMYVNNVNRKFLSTYSVKIIFGKDFQKSEKELNKNQVLINEASLKLLGLETAEAIGERLNDDDNNVYTIIGVFQDYHKTSPKEKIGPMIMKFNPVRGYFTVSYAAEQNPLSDKRVEELRAIWDKVYTDQPFEFISLDTYYKNQFNDESQLLRVMKLLTFIAVFLGCFSLVGLSLYEITDSKLEVGIRKTFGATSFQIIILFVKKYLILFLGVILMILPIAYYSIGRWLNDFHYRIDMNIAHILLPALILLFVSLLTIVIQIVKASNVNPVKVIREK